MTAEVVQIDALRARRAAARARHPSVPLVSAGNERTAHAVDARRTTAVLAAGAAYAITLCGRDAYPADTLHPDAALCRACARHLTGSH